MHDAGFFGELSVGSDRARISLPWLDAHKACARLRPDAEVRHIRKIDPQLLAGRADVFNASASKLIKDQRIVLKKLVA